ncbi:hypothetical protein Tco_1256026 [Tanacetum coccineum]
MVRERKRVLTNDPELFAKFPINLSSPEFGDPSDAIISDAEPIFAMTRLQRSCLNTDYSPSLHQRMPPTEQVGNERIVGIVCHGKVVRIPLEGDEILRVHGERTQGVVKTLMNTKVVEFRVDLVPGATPVAKSPYRLAPLEMQELSEQLQELQDEEEHGVHLKLELELLRKEKLYAKVTYLRFIANFSKIVKPITSLTERNQKYEWGAERKEAF